MNMPLSIKKYINALRKAGDIILPLMVLAALLLTTLHHAPLVTVLQNAVFDRYNRWYPRPINDSPVLYIDIDEASLRVLGQFPWPRHLFADLIENLTAYGAAAIALDILFSEPDRNSPTAILPVWQELNTNLPASDWQSMATSLRRNITDPDDRLADVLRRTPTIIAMMLNDAGGALPPTKSGFALRQQNQNANAPDPLVHVPLNHHAITNHAPLQKAANGLGAINAQVDQDGIIRRTSLIFRGGDRLYPSLGLEALRVAQGASSITLKASDIGDESHYASGMGLSRLKVGQFVVPIEPNGSVRLYYGKSANIERIPAWEILSDDFDVSRLQGRIVFIGSSAAGLKDLRATPINPAIAGVEVHVQTAQQIIDGVYLRRPLWLQTLELLSSLIAGLVIVLMVYFLGLVAGGATLLLGGVSIGGVSLWAYQNHLLLLDPTVPFFTMAATYLIAGLLRYIRTEKEREGVRSAFGQYLSPELVEKIARDPANLKLGGEVKPITIMFCDIRGFTALSENLQDAPHILTHIINRFMTVMSRCIQDNHGTIDKYIGDSIMAFWNAPAQVPQHALCACHAALDMQAKLDTLNKDLNKDPKVKDLWQGTLRIGIGLNTGNCLVGNIGSDQRFNYSVMGDPVNIAARLEGQTKNYGVVTLVGQETRQAASHDGALAFAELDLISLKGKDKPERIYALLGDSALADNEDFADTLKMHERFIHAYRAQNWVGAKKLAATLEKALPALKNCYALYLERMAFFQTHPPDENWDGVFKAVSK